MRALANQSAAGVRSLAVGRAAHGPHLVAPSILHDAKTRRAVVANVKPGETEEQAWARRMRESEEVQQAAVMIESLDQFRRDLSMAGDRLVVLEIQSDTVCETGFDEPQPDLNWKLDVEKEHRERMEKCKAIKHTFQRVARECPDVEFMTLVVDQEEPKDREMMSYLGVDTLPTIQFYKNNSLLWEHKGVMDMDQKLGKGVLFYGDSAGGGEKATQFVTELGNRADYHAFVAGSGPEDKELKVVMVATAATPCVHVYPAVVALARNFQGVVAFSRLMGDSNRNGVQALLRELNVVEVPTFLFFRGGRYTGRLVSSSRGDLIGNILSQQASAGIAPPPPPKPVAKAAPFRRGLNRRVRA